MHTEVLPRLRGLWRASAMGLVVWAAACARIGYDLQGGTKPGAEGGAAGNNADNGVGGMLGGGGASSVGGTGPKVPTVVWGRLFPAVENTDALPGMHAVATSAQGNPVVAGNVQGTVSLSPTVTSNGQSESLLVEYSPDNVYLWHNRFSDGGGAENFAWDLAVVPSGLVIAGEFQGKMDAQVSTLNAAMGQVQSYVIATDPKGIVKFATQVDGATGVFPACIAGAWVAVNVGISVKFGTTSLPASMGFAIGQFSPGYDTTLQAKGFQDSDGLITEEVKACAAASDESFFLAGRLGSPVDFGSGAPTLAGGEDGFIAAFSANGQGLWSQAIGGTGNDTVRKLELAPSKSMLYVLSSYNGTLTVGAAATSAGLQDILITGHDPLNGQVKWTLPLGSISNDDILASAVDTSGNLVFAGSHRAPLTVGVSSAQGTTKEIGTFLASVDAQGKLLWVMDLADLGVEDLAVAANGDIYAVGFTSDTVVTNAETLVPNPTAGFLIKLAW